MVDDDEDDLPAAPKGGTEDCASTVRLCFHFIQDGAISCCYRLLLGLLLQCPHLRHRVVVCPHVWLRSMDVGVK